MRFTAITPTHCQNLFDSENLQEKAKTCEELYGLLSVIFKAATAQGLMSKTSLHLVIKVKLVRVLALTNDAISKMLRKLSRSKGAYTDLSDEYLLREGAKLNDTLIFCPTFAPKSKD